MEQENSSASTGQENTLGHPLSKIRLNYAISQRSRFSRILFYVTASYGCYGLADYGCHGLPGYGCQGLAGYGCHGLAG